MNEPLKHILSKRSNTQKILYSMIPFIKISKTGKTNLWVFKSQYKKKKVSILVIIAFYWGGWIVGDWIKLGEGTKGIPGMLVIF